MTEQAYLLEQDGERLFQFLHRPDGPCRGAVLLCAPLAEEKLWSHRVFVSFARELSRRSYAALRFDYRGEGDSDRAFEQSSLKTRLEDTARAIDELKRQVPGVAGVTLVGLRLGATVAAMASAGRSDVRELVLWDPVVDGKEYVQSVLRANLMFQMAHYRRIIEDREALVERMNRGETVNVEGYGLGGDLYRELSAIRLTETVPGPGVRILIVSIGGREAPPRGDLVALRDAWSGASLATVAEQPFWREIREFYRRAPNLTAATSAWLESAA